MRCLALHQARAPLIAELLRVIDELLADQLGEPRLALEDLFDLIALFRELRNRDGEESARYGREQALLKRAGR